MEISMCLFFEGEKKSVSEVRETSCTLCQCFVATVLSQSNVAEQLLYCDSFKFFNNNNHIFYKYLA